MLRYLMANWRRGVRVVLLTVAISLLALLGVLAYLSWQYAHYFTHVGCVGLRDSLSTQEFASEPITIDTARGYQLRGWFTQGNRSPEVAIIVLPGGPGNTQFALPDAQMLASAGYSTLIYEHRSCADPALLHSGGYLEADDLVSAVQYLRARPDIRHIGILGFSAGGTTALLAAAKEPDIEAVIAEGGFSSLEEDALQGQSSDNPLDWLIRRMVLVFLGLELRVSPSDVSPTAHIAEISPRPVFLIYGEFEALHGEMLYAAAEDPKQLWIVPGVGHGGYQAAYPDEYEMRVVSFFDSVFTAEP